MLSTSSFIERCSHIHNNKYEYTSKHISGHGCTKCAISFRSKLKTKALPEFIGSVNLLHNNKFDYSKVIYVNRTTKVKIICPEHGEFEQTPANHLQGNGCYLCRNVDISIRNSMSLEEFIEKAKFVHNNKYDYSSVVYLGNKQKVKIICPEHGEFEQVVNDHLAQHGCRSCKKSKGEMNINRWLTNNKFTFEIEKVFPDCKYTHNLLFDFYLPDFNLCIEYDGEHHYKVVQYNGYSLELAQQRYDLIQIKDNIKTRYCKDNNINLLRISYTEFKQIDNILSDYMKGINKCK
jgi:very-short-patch-repair endonuclease